VGETKSGRCNWRTLPSALVAPAGSNERVKRLAANRAECQKIVPERGLHQTLLMRRADVVSALHTHSRSRERYLKQPDTMNSQHA
jgi:hypothetical protein